MKKAVILGLMAVLVNVFMIANVVFASQNSQVIKNAIQKYKNRNFIGCISDLKLLTEKDPSSAVAWYYLGNSYMNISMKPEAHEAFDMVVNLNTVPALTSYAIQAKLCMENPTKCTYYQFTLEQIEELKADPVTFLDNYLEKKDVAKDPETDEIEKLIEGEYDKVHPEAKEFIDQEKLKMEQSNINRAYLPSEDRMAQVINLIQTRQNDMSNFAMMMNTDSQQNNNYNAMMKYIESTDKKNISPEAIQLMMMQNSMLNF